MKKIIVTGSEGFIGKNFLDSVKDKFIIIRINEDIFSTENWYHRLEEILNDTNQ